MTLKCLWFWWWEKLHYQQKRCSSVNKSLQTTGVYSTFSAHIFINMLNGKDLKMAQQNNTISSLSIQTGQSIVQFSLISIWHILNMTITMLSSVNDITSFWITGSRIRGAVSRVKFDEFHKHSMTLIQAAVFGMTDDGKIKDKLKFTNQLVRSPC